MKKILILGQVPKEYGGNYTTGVANVIMSLALPLSRNYQVYIYGTNLNEGAGQRIPNIHFLGYSKKEIGLGLLKKIVLSPLGFIREWIQYRKTYGVPPLRFMAYRIQIQKDLKKIRPDIVNAHGMIFAPVTAQLGINADTIFSFHGFMHDDPASISANKSRGIEMAKLYLRGAGLVQNSIYLTPAMQRKGQEVLGIQDQISTIISNGVDVEKFRFSASQRKLIRGQFGLEANDLVFISVGALTARKNHGGFIDFLERNQIPCHYWIVGKDTGTENETIQKLDSLIEQTSFVKTRRIAYVPHQELYAYYSAADIYAHPSTSEGQALVAMEALCSGLPLIVNEQIKDTIGLDSEFEQFIDYVNLSNSELPPLRAPDREHLSEVCREKLSWEASAEKYSDFFLKFQDEKR
ncbi:glycosyltransferase family 4 protein [Robiginitalea sp. IMCC43444]|uniref:glycosyltransferase family 4 protein n=1 Tax=Robiginitalea sp. IMCC43444 TaxID=3459121 RepID=UPI004042C59D